MSRAAELVTLPAVDLIGRKIAQVPEVERAILATAMRSPDAREIIVGRARREHFFVAPHGLVFAAIEALHRAKRPVDDIAIIGWLSDRRHLEGMGGADFVIRLGTVQAPVEAAHVSGHLDLLIGSWTTREAANVGYQMATAIYGDVGDPTQWISTSQMKLAALSDQRRTHEGEHISTVIHRTLKGCQERENKGVHSRGIPTGYPDLDKAIGGLVEGRVTYLAARPGVGKSSLARCIANNVATAAMFREGPSIGVVVIQLEGTKEEVVGAMLCAYGNVNGMDFAAGELDLDGWRAIQEAAYALGKAPIFVEDKPATVDDIIAIVRAAQASFDRPEETKDGVLIHEKRIGVVVLDFIQRVRPDDPKMKRNEALGVISRRLSDDVAKALKVHLIAIAAMNRDIEKRKGGDAQLSDLRDCGDLESDADAVIFLDRPLADDKVVDREGNVKKDPNVMSGYFAKNRYGIGGARFRLRFFGPSRSFGSLRPGEDEQ